MAKRTSFLFGFGPLLFGRGSKFTLKKVQAIRSLESFFEMFGDFVPARFLSKETKRVNSRERELPPWVIFWAFVIQVLDPGSSCREILRKGEAWWRCKFPHEDVANALTTSADCQARKRLGWDTIQLIKEHLVCNHMGNPIWRYAWEGQRVRG
ncbi:MAG: hypothetical protein RLZZ253_2429 [Verrucomicrobiota bacterium]